MVTQPHIKLDNISKYCFLSGNPDRISIIAEQLRDPVKLSDHRGLISYSGYSMKQGIPITLITTGMGAPSTAIVLEEAYRAGGRTMIRIGSCGSLQSGKQHGIGSIHIPYAAIREESTSRRLVPLEYPATATPNVYQALLNSATSYNIKPIEGLVWTSDIYYFQDPQYFKKYSKLGATCVEMESSLLFSYPALKHDLKVGSILTSDGNLNEEDSIYAGSVEENIIKFTQSVNDTIDIAISAVELLDQNEEK